MDLLEWFKSVDLNTIQAFVAERRAEDVQLDFKTVNSPAMNGDDKKNFAKALSGFANSSGGLVVWGIDARKTRRNGQEIDCASRLCPITDIAVFCSKLNDFEGQFVCPIVDGVRHKMISTTGTQGYAVTLIPESFAAPHMAKGGEGRYYKRSGDSFYPMEHFDIEDMFGRRKKPDLNLIGEILPGATLRKLGIVSYECDILVSIQNTGRGIARFCDLHIRVNNPYEINWRGEGTLSPRRTNKQGYSKFSADSHTVIHPDSVFQITRIKVAVPESGSPHAIPNAAIEYHIDAEDMRRKEGTLLVCADDIIRVAYTQRKEN